MYKGFDLTGQVALVTGGNGGIGRAIALALAEAGADIAIAARNQEKTRRVVDEVTALGRRALGIACDVTRPEQISAAVETTVEEMGRLLILVNNAGTSRGGMPETVSDEQWALVQDTNLTATFRFCRAAYPELVRNGGGKIINVASGYAIVANVMDASYGASKAAVVHLTKSLASAWAKDNIQVNAILPGLIRTEMTSRLTDYPERLGHFLSVTPAGRVGEPEEFGGPAVLLASPASSYLTGHALVVDGGLLTADLLMDFRRLHGQGRT